MKKRLGRSPDLFDNLMVGIEGARRMGFKIQRLGMEIEKKRKPDAFDKLLKDAKELRSKRQLVSA